MKAVNKWRRIAIAALAGSVAAGIGFSALGHGSHGWHGRGGAAMDPVKMDERIESGVKRVLGGVDASDEQRARVTQIARQAAAELRGLRAQQMELRSKGLALLAAPEVDRAAIEALRAEQVRLVDAASKRISAALADTADVLTQAQRAKLAEHMKARGGRWKHG